MPNKQVKISMILIQIIIWILGIIAGFLLFIRHYMPVYSTASTNVGSFTYTPALMPGDTIKQSFKASLNNYSSLSIAFTYDEAATIDTKVLISVFQNDTLILEQPMTVLGGANNSFLDLSIDISDCIGSIITLQVENISEEDSESNQFSMLAASKLGTRPDTLSNYFYNEQEQDTCLLLKYTYLSGYTYYPALTYGFSALLITLILTSFISKQLRNLHL